MLLADTVYLGGGLGLVILIIVLFLLFGRGRW